MSASDIGFPNHVYDMHHVFGTLWTQWKVLESPPSFCNGQGTIYIACFRGRTFWSYYQRYGFEV